MAARGGGKRVKRYGAETKLIAKEKTAKTLADQGITIVADQDGTGSESKFCWNVTITGPAKYVVNGTERDSPYAGKQFSLELQFPDKYPFKPPVPIFKPPLYHPNVEQSGDDAGKLCEDFIKHFWTGPTKKAHEFVIHILGLLASPDLDTALDETIAAEIRESTAKFEKKVAGLYK
mmetsp:Transcript_3940/g.8528  ORF Transcript_3940/g.8528 Transcript_3940/m.8528 type:complete len:176 (-) Transcript_3940:61-588(-)